MSFILTADIIVLLLLLLLSVAQALQQVEGGIMDRRKALAHAITAPAAGAIIITAHPKVLGASNLPASTGASLTRTGSVETLIPIVRIQNTLEQSLLQSKRNNVASNNNIQTLSDQLLHQPQQSTIIIPLAEKEFKRIFDEFSDPVSYKQRFMDQNAFLVYYTKGYDGPNRPSMEDNDNNMKQVMQYGIRNEVWIAWSELQSELQYQVNHPENIDDDVVQPLIGTMLQAINRYLELVPANILAEAKRASV